MSVTALHVPYKLALEPIVRIGEYVLVPAGKRRGYHRVTYIDTAPDLLIVETVPAGAGVTAPPVEVELTDLELHEREAGQWRMLIQDPILVTMTFPRGVEKWLTKEKVLTATPASPGNLLEFYTVEDSVPILRLINPFAEDLVARVRVYGLRYSLEPYAGVPDKYTVFPVYSARWVVGGR